jgi:hypothetical protein
MLKAKHFKEVNKVLETKDYGVFKKLKGNRELDNRHVQKLMKSIEEEQLQIPIIVNDKFEIIDGQNRLSAIAQLGKPVFFIIVKGYGIEQVTRANTNHDKWVAEDYLHRYINEGKEDYVKYKEFQEKYGFAHQISLSLLTGAQAGGKGGAPEAFENGTFKITQLKKANDIGDKIHRIKQYYDGYKRRSFVFAMVHALEHPEFDFDKFMQKLQYMSTELVHAGSVKQYLTMLETIFNWKNNKKVWLSKID